MHIPEDEAERRRLNERGREILRRKNGAVRPHREDGYVNLLNKYGTKQDNSEAYKFEREPVIPDMQLTGLYEGNGLFSKIIDTPAEEALKHGFDLNLKSDEVNAFVEDALDDLEWEEKAATAIKWARLYGGALIVMLIDDGRGLEEPVDWEHICSIDELRVYERSIVQPDSSSLYQQDYGGKGVGNRVSKFGQPEYYYVSSIYGSFKVHESRCLVFRNGVLPEQTSNATYLFWGMPEYVRIRRALRETVTAHTDSVKLLERSVQAIYSMKGLASLLTTDDGENQVLKRLQLVDTSRGLLNSIAIDSEGEQYDFKTFQFSGVKDVIDATCNMLSALTNIPQTILFGRSPAGMNATGDSDFESYYNFVEKIQRLMLKRNLRTLLDVVFRAGIASGDVTEEPDYKLEFNPLWSLSDTEQAAVDQTKAQTALVKAQTAQAYVDMQALDPTEVRRRLASDEEFDVEDIISEDDEADLVQSLLGTEPSVMSDVEAAQKNLEQGQAPGGMEQTMPAIANADAEDGNWVTINGTHVLIDENGVAQSGGKLVGESLKSAQSQKNSAAATASSKAHAYNSKISKSYKEGDYTKVLHTVRECVDEAPIGSKFESNGRVYIKTGDGQFEYTFKGMSARKYSAVTNTVVNDADPFHPENALKFEDFAVETTKKSPDATIDEPKAENSKKTEITPYAGKTDFPGASVPREAISKKKIELTKNLEKKDSHATITDNDMENFTSALTDYLQSETCQRILSAQDEKTYSTLRGWMSEDEKTWAKKQCDRIEQFINLSDKVDEPLFRGMSFNSAYDTSGNGKKFIDSLTEGNTISMGHIASWTSERGLARSFANGALDFEADEGELYSVIMCVSRPKTAASTGGILPTRECLSPKDAKYRVVSVKKEYDDNNCQYLYDVDLEEV